MRKIIFIFIFLPIIIEANSVSMLIPVNDNISANPFGLYQIVYKGTHLSYIHDCNNIAHTDFTFIYPTEWNGVAGINLYISDFESFTLFNGSGLSNNPYWGINLNYSNFLMEIPIGLAMNVNMEKKINYSHFYDFSIGYRLRDQYSGIVYAYIDGGYLYQLKTIDISCGFYSYYYEKLYIQLYYKVGDVLGSKHSEWIIKSILRLPISFMIGADFKYDYDIESSFDAGFDFHMLKLFGGIAFNNLDFKRYYFQIVISNEFGDMVRF